MWRHQWVLFASQLLWEHSSCYVFRTSNHVTEISRRFAVLSLGRDWSFSPSLVRQHSVPECRAVWSLVEAASALRILPVYGREEVSPSKIYAIINAVQTYSGRSFLRTGTLRNYTLVSIGTPNKFPLVNDESALYFLSSLSGQLLNILDRL